MNGNFQLGMSLLGEQLKRLRVGVYGGRSSPRWLRPVVGCSVPMIDAAYCLDAPSMLPAGSVRCDDWFPCDTHFDRENYVRS